MCLMWNTAELSLSIQKTRFNHLREENDPEETKKNLKALLKENSDAEGIKSNGQK